MDTLYQWLYSYVFTWQQYTQHMTHISEKKEIHNHKVHFLAPVIHNMNDINTISSSLDGV